jgi:hypothetical protein
MSEQLGRRPTHLAEANIPQEALELANRLCPPGGHVEYAQEDPNCLEITRSDGVEVAIVTFGDAEPVNDENVYRVGPRRHYDPGEPPETQQEAARVVADDPAMCDPSDRYHAWNMLDDGPSGRLFYSKGRAQGPQEETENT